MNPSNLNSFWGFLIVEEIIRNGYDYFILSPGSRCTPLTVAVARHPKTRKIIYYDERGAAFHGLGYAQATGNPAILICTSGSAAANYYPAVIEASINHLPLIILSADRPPELQQTGANQTIQQDNLYGKYVKWSLNLPCPDEEISPKTVLSIIDQACYFKQGVVHLNCAFREPLAPTFQSISNNYYQSIELWKNSSDPYHPYTSSLTVVHSSDLERIIKVLRNTQKGILCIGRLSNIQEQKAILELAKILNWPVFADIQSGLRLNGSIPQIIPYFDQLLLKENFCQTYPIETVLQIGDRFTSKRFAEWLKKAQLKHHIMITNYPERHDPEQTVSLKIESDITIFCEQIIKSLPVNLDNTLYKEFQQKSEQIESIIDNYFLDHPILNEPLVSRLVSRYIPSNHGLYLANSMAIREMDMYGISNNQNIRIAANRGTSGIEGTIATASGFAMGLKTPVTVIIGDLAFLHDLNSLSSLKSLNYPLIIILINNDGGGIFSFLPIAEFTDIFEPYFGTPHGLTFKSAANLFEVNYYQPQTQKEFIQVYQTALKAQKSCLIEVMTQRSENYQYHQELQQNIKRVL